MNKNIRRWVCPLDDCELSHFQEPPHSCSRKDCSITDTREHADKKNDAVRIMVALATLPILRHEDVKCTSPSGHHWDNQGRCHTCGVPHPDTQYYFRCTNNPDHRATVWSYDPQFDTHVALCDECAAQILAYNNEERERQTKLAAAQADILKERNRLN